jgi:hypothetical protein
VLLLLGAALDQGAGEDLGPGDERAPHAERSSRQLLGGDDHAQVVALTAGGEAAVLLGHREPEAAHLGQPRDDFFGDVGVGAVHVLGHRAHLVLREATEGLLHQLEVGVEVAGPFLAGERGQELRVTVGREERYDGLERVGLEPPLLLPAEHPGHEVVHRVGDERARDPALDLAPSSVVEDGTGELDPRGRVREVVGEHLVVVDRTVRGEQPGGPGHDVVCDVDDRGRALQVGCGHGPRLSTAGYRRRATTVTSSGSTTGSSPGLTPVRCSR